MNKEQENPYWSRMKRHFARNRFAVWSLRVVFFLLFIALFGDFIANEKPLYCKIEGKTHFPVVQEYLINAGLKSRPEVFRTQDWQNYKYEKVVRPLIPYSSGSTDMYNAFVSPFAEQSVPSTRFRHWLGTDKLGRDLAAGLVAGTRTALLVGLLAMSISLVIGLFLGGIAGYFGDYGLKISRSCFIFNLIGLPLAFFWSFISRSYILTETGGIWAILTSIFLFFGIMAIFNLLAKFAKRFSFFSKKTRIPVDMVVMRLIEVVGSIPGLLLILAFVAIIKEQSIYKVMIIIGLISWRRIALFVRAELMRIKTTNYIEASRAMGFSDARILMKHALPNAMTPVLIAVSFGIAGAILAEATLSFLGIGIPADQVTWGSMLQDARVNFNAWWLAIFPGLAIFITVTIFNLIGDGLADLLDANSGNKL